jgi:hypothetical protein
MQAWPWAALGTRSSSSGLNSAATHQQAGCFWPVAFSISMAQKLAFPHRGHKLGLMGVVFSGSMNGERGGEWLGVAIELAVDGVDITGDCAAIKI